jgi:hypothetical protein
MPSYRLTQCMPIRDLHPVPQVYADQMLPEPDELTLPMCWHEDLLDQLQHPAIINAAKAQQVRLGGFALLGGVDRSVACHTFCAHHLMFCSHVKRAESAEMSHAVAACWQHHMPRSAAWSLTQKVSGVPMHQETLSAKLLAILYAIKYATLYDVLVSARPAGAAAHPAASRVHDSH